MIINIKRIFLVLPGNHITFPMTVYVPITLYLLFYIVSLSSDFQHILPHPHSPCWPCFLIHWENRSNLNRPSKLFQCQFTYLAESRLVCFPSCHEWTVCSKAILLCLISCLLRSIPPTNFLSRHRHFPPSRLYHFNLLSLNQFCMQQSECYKCKSEHFTHLFIILQWLSFIPGIKFKLLNLVCKVLCDLAPNYLMKLILYLV